MNQRQATVNTLLAVLADRGIEYELNGETPIKQVLKPADKEKARVILMTMFREKQVTYRPDFQSKVDNDKELKSYVGGLINNWIAKAPEFNNNTKHQIKNPGSRAGTGDDTVRELKKLMSLTTDPSVKSEIQAAIDERLEKIGQTKKVEVDMSKIPDSLKQKLGLV